jgi:hypothetical protein
LMRSSSKIAATTWSYTVVSSACCIVRKISAHANQVSLFQVLST